MTETDLDDAERRLAAIESALERLEEGSYGRCAACGSELGEERLEKDPTATVCAPCATARTGGGEGGE